MKNLLTVIMALFFVFFLVASGYSKIDEKTIVAIWLLDEDKGNVANDSSGNNHEGAINNAKWIPGKFGPALDLSGGQMSVPHADSLTLQDHTISFWAKVPKITGQWQLMISKEAGGPARNYGIYVDLNNGAVHYGFSSANQWKSGTAATPITDGKWHHIAQAYNIKKLSFKLYIDGKIDFQRVDGSKPDTNNSSVMFGANSLAGSLDDIIMFNVGLEEEDILELMNNGIKGVLTPKAVNVSHKLATNWAKIRSHCIQHSPDGPSL